ncbi:MAG: glutamate synthase subunit alpha, partial [Actinomycetota bacterium]|nr:glutamate synthase subunit alpha [Actinomycetota bacterium]
MPVSLLDGYATTPARQGLYDPQFERDACGVALVATLSGVPSNDVVKQALTALENLGHRGASGSEPDSGDGAGILIQVPDALLRRVSGIELPEPGAYATGVGFFPTGGPTRDSLMAQIDEIARDEEIAILGWRCVPTDPSLVGVTARECMPDFWQIFAVDARNATSGLDLDRRVYALRKRVENELGVYFASLSSRTMVYKGMLTTDQLTPFYPDLSEVDIASTLALVHSRFSTNTFPSWPLAHPYRLIAHNGEINTVAGNRNWMTTREAMLTSDVLSGDLTRLSPICTPGASDSASFDE